MSDLTPPSDQPLPEQARARIRADLLAAARESRGDSRLGRWLVPGVAAAAVLVVAGVAAWAVQAGGGGTDGSPAVVAPTGSSTRAPGETAPSETPTAPPPGQRAGAGSCRAELASTLPGAELAAEFDDHTSFWVAGDRFALCDVRGGVTTVHKPVSLSAPRGVAPFRVSTVYTPEKGGLRVTRVAGGLVATGAEDVFRVHYVFADGHVEEATTVEDDQGRTWWRMVHTSESDGGNETKRPPITATLSLSGVQETYPLDWATDTCAQVNHGC